jgi:hypothetical protein
VVFMWPPIRALTAWPPNGLELSCPAEAGSLPPILAHAGGPGAQHYGPARRVSFSELLGADKVLIASCRSALFLLFLRCPQLCQWRSISGGVHHPLDCQSI